MAKGGLSNQLLGKKIIPQPGLLRIWPKKNGVDHNKFPEEESDLLFTEATIMAAWVEGGGRDGESYVKVSAMSDNGDVAEFYLKHVKIKIETGGTNESV